MRIITLPFLSIITTSLISMEGNIDQFLKALTSMEQFCEKIYQIKNQPLHTKEEEIFKMKETLKKNSEILDSFLQEHEDSSIFKSSEKPKNDLLQ
jgi:hypothetical protein